MITVLVVGATGSIGQLVVDEALRQGHDTRALSATRTAPAGCRPRPPSSAT